MGHKIIRTIFVLHFEDGSALDGATVKVRSVSMRKLLEIMRLAETLHSLGDRATEDVDALFTALAEQLVSWDLEEEEGTPIPCSVEGMYSLEFDLVLSIVFAWIEGVQSTPGPLGPSSKDGSRSEQPPIPMESLAPSPALL